MSKRVLFLCTGNAARSQMAEALARLDWPAALAPVSAGSRPTGWVHPLAIRAMEELGVSMEDAYSKPAEEFRDEAFDVVVTVCDSAAEDCPTWPNARRIEHWSIEDPSFGGDAATRYERFVETRDDLRRRIRELGEGLLREEADPAG
jgi:arsenate reductase (thioredoxin)